MVRASIWMNTKYKNKYILDVLFLKSELVWSLLRNSILSLLIFIYLCTRLRIWNILSSVLSMKSTHGKLPMKHQNSSSSISVTNICEPKINPVQNFPTSPFFFHLRIVHLSTLLWCNLSHMRMYWKILSVLYRLDH